jgi:hypothetical protein
VWQWVCMASGTYSGRGDARWGRACGARAGASPSFRLKSRWIFGREHAREPVITG